MVLDSSVFRHLYSMDSTKRGQKKKLSASKGELSKLFLAFSRYAADKIIDGNILSSHIGDIFVGGKKIKYEVLENGEIKGAPLDVIAMMNMKKNCLESKKSLRPAKLN